MEFHLWILVLAFFFIALVYASVGFGGGSSYLALLAQPYFLLTPDAIRPLALMCNIVVVTGGCILFVKEDKIRWKEVWPFLVSSVPLAYLGGRIKLQADTFFILLGFVLIIAAVTLWFQPQKSKSELQLNKTAFGLVSGGGIGFLSGLVSIGGGIFLSPMLHLVHWGEARRISALASLFILVNSISGLAGQFRAGIPELNYKLLLPLLAAVFVGGQLGSRLGAKKFNPIHIKRITAILILFAAWNILKRYM